MAHKHITKKIEDADDRWQSCDLLEDSEDHVACKSCGTHVAVDDASDDCLCRECAEN